MTDRVSEHNHPHEHEHHHHVDEHEHQHEHHHHGDEHQHGHHHHHHEEVGHHHCYGHGAESRHSRRLPGETALIIRPYSGISGDIMVAGLSALAGIDGPCFDQMLRDLNLEKLVGRVSLGERLVNHVLGAGLTVDMPDEHEHRNLSDIVEFFGRTSLDDAAKDLAVKTFRLLAEAEGAVHGYTPEKVSFHEVGALDSIMDIGLSAMLLARLGAKRLVCGPLPICDGVIKCQHGLMLSPAPAVLKLLTGVPVVSLASRGETVTPTGIALLKAAEVEFGPWPAVTIERQALAYGTRYFEGVPNGVLFAFGREHEFGQ